MEQCSALMMSIHRMPQPVIAAIEGFAVAGGFEVALACDLVVAAEGHVGVGQPGLLVGVEVVRRVEHREDVREAAVSALVHGLVVAVLARRVAVLERVRGEELAALADDARQRRDRCVSDVDLEAAIRAAAVARSVVGLLSCLPRLRVLATTISITVEGRKRTPAWSGE